MGEKIVGRATFLAPNDRALIEAVFRDHIPIATLARATGSSPNRISRRIRILLRRLMSARFIWVISHRADWPDERRRIADAHYLQGATQRATARSLGISIHRVRSNLAALRALEEVSNASPSPSPQPPERHP